MLRALCLLAVAAAPAAAQTFTALADPLPSLRPTLGPALVDVDGNGRVDIVTSQWLYLQRAEGFVARPIPTGHLLGIIAGDADGDGLPELALLEANAPKLSRFDPLADALAPPETLPIAAADFPLVQGSVWLDEDRDGHLDLLLGNDGPPDVLLRGDGAGAFTDVSTARLPNVDGGTYGMAAADFDRDGDLDIAIGLCAPLPANNLIYRHDGNGFREVGADTGADDPRASWGVAWLDYNGDGWLDLYVANMPVRGSTVPGWNSLFRNLGNGRFADVAAGALVDGPRDEASWNVAAADFDNDGHIDLFVANDPAPSRLFRNRGDGTFEDQTVASGLGGLADTGLAVGDVNGDGWVDVFLPRTDGALYLNDGGTNGWLAVRLRGTASNPDGIGARVEVRAGGRTRVREITAGDGMMAHSHALEAHVGLGAEATADVTVRWPSGAVTTVPGVAASQRITIVEGEGLNAAPGGFALQPVSEARLGEAVPLRWSAAADADPVTYTVTVRHEDGAETVRTTTETGVDVEGLTAEGAYTWTVRATDGRSVRMADGPGAFVLAVVAAEASPEASPFIVTAFPTPAAGRVEVRVEGASGPTTVALVDLLGRRVATARVDVQGAAAFDVSRLPPGVYIARADDGHRRSAARVVVAR